jgi:predicted GH43/DUF377 family glycosyl hydrolase
MLSHQRRHQWINHRATAHFAIFAALLLIATLTTALPGRTVERLPAFESGATVLHDASFTNGGLQHPTIIRAADHINDPLGDYYLYFGTQNAGGIGLAYSDSPEGPWTEYEHNPVVSGASGPHAIWDDESGELLLYLHRTGQQIELATSADGLQFASPQPSVTLDDFPGVSLLQLPRVFEYSLPSMGNRFTMLAMGLQNGTRKIFLAHSEDGRSWTVRTEPVVSPSTGEGGQIASPHLLEWGDDVFIAYHAASGNVHVTEVGADINQEDHLGVFHAPMATEPDRGRVAAPAFLTVDDTLHMFYEAGPSGSARIGVATSDGEPRGPGDGNGGDIDRPDFPSFEHAGVVIDPDDQQFNPTDEFIFPSIIRAADHFDEPLAEYYLYYAPHENPGGIALAYSDSPAGPWTEYEHNPVIANPWPPHFSVSHISTPHAFWNDDENLLFLYFHGENHQTRLATSVDGLAFDYDSIVLTTADIPGNSEASYARVFEHTIPSKGNRYVMMLMGNESGTRKIWLAWSDDARHWTAQPTPLISPSADEGGQISSPWFFPWEDRYFVVYHSGAGTMHATEVGENFDREDHLGVFYESSTGLRSAAPSFITEGDTMYMFYELGHRLNAKIAYATADLSVTSPCSPPDARATVMTGDVDSGVENRDTGDGCTINDLIEDDVPWDSNGAFVRHVRDVLNPLVAADVIDPRERAAITAAAARSDVGRSS